MRDMEAGRATGSFGCEDPAFTGELRPSTGTKPGAERRQAALGHTVCWAQPWGLPTCCHDSLSWLSRGPQTTEEAPGFRGVR